MLSRFVGKLDCHLLQSIVDRQHAGSSQGLTEASEAVTVSIVESAPQDPVTVLCCDCTATDTHNDCPSANTNCECNATNANCDCPVATANCDCSAANGNCDCSATNVICDCPAANANCDCLAANDTPLSE